jgi:ELWxxDGT repeat protein
VITNTLYFSAGSSSTGYELWKTDGTNPGTTQVKDIYSGSTSSAPSNLINGNGTLYFIALSPSVGRELWKSDGTSAGTVLVADNIRPGSSSSNIFEMTVSNNILFFQADDFTTYGRELWTVNLSGSSSVPELMDANSTITVYPNPGNGVYTIKRENDKPYSIKLYNALGSLVKEETNVLDTSHVIDISTEPSGIYFVQIGSVSKKIIKQ